MSEAVVYIGPLVICKTGNRNSVSLGVAASNAVDGNMIMLSSDIGEADGFVVWAPAVGGVDGRNFTVNPTENSVFDILDNGGQVAELEWLKTKFRKEINELDNIYGVTNLDVRWCVVTYIEDN